MKILIHAVLQLHIIPYLFVISSQLYAILSKNPLQHLLKFTFVVVVVALGLLCELFYYAFNENISLYGDCETLLRSLKNVKNVDTKFIIIFFIIFIEFMNEIFEILFWIFSFESFFLWHYLICVAETSFHVLILILKHLNIYYMLYPMDNNKWRNRKANTNRFLPFDLCFQGIQ